MGGFGGMNELAPLCALFCCTILLMTSLDDPDHVHLKGLLGIYKPSAAARARLGAPLPFGSAEVAIFHVDAFQAAQYLSSEERPTTILLELGNQHCRGFLRPARETPLSCISLASLKPFQTRDDNLSFRHSPLREVYSKVKELQTEGSPACEADMAARQLGLADAEAKLKRARKEVRRLVKGQSAAPSLRKVPRRSGKTTEATQAVDQSMSVLHAKAYVLKWKKLRDQDNFRRPWPVRRRDAQERPGASHAAASSESESGSSDAQGDSGDGADDSGEGADSSKKNGKGGKLPGEKKRERVIPPKNRFPQERKEQQQGALVPTRIADTKVFAFQYERTTACLVAGAASGWQYKLNGTAADTLLAHGKSIAKGTQAALCEMQRAPQGGAEGHLDGLRKRLVYLLAHLQERSSASSSLAQRARCCANALALLDVFIGARGVNPLARLCAADDAHAGEISLLSTNAVSVYAFICFYEIDGAECRAACSVAVSPSHL